MSPVSIKTSTALLCRVEVGVGKWLDGGRCGREMRLKLSAGTTFDNDQPFVPIRPTETKAIDYHLNDYDRIVKLPLFSAISGCSTYSAMLFRFVGRVILILYP